MGGDLLSGVEWVIARLWTTWQLPTQHPLKSHPGHNATSKWCVIEYY